MIITNKTKDKKKTCPGSYPLAREQRSCWKLQLSAAEFSGFLIKHGTLTCITRSNGRRLSEPYKAMMIECDGKISSSGPGARERAPG